MTHMRLVPDTPTSTTREALRALALHAADVAIEHAEHLDEDNEPCATYTLGMTTAQALIDVIDHLDTEGDK